MSYLDKRVLLKANLETRSIKEEKQSEIFFYNTDENIANLYMKLIYVTDDGLSKELQKDEVSGYSLKMTAIKPKTNQIREVDGVLSEDLSNNEGTCAIFKFQLGTEFTNQIGNVICCTKIIKDAQKLNMDYFVYTIKADKLTGLNAEITSNPDLPVLKQLIKEVKETAQTVNNIDDVNITDTKTFSNKKIEEKFTDVDSQIKYIAKDVLLEDGKLYLKKSDGTKLGAGVVLPVGGGGINSKSIKDFGAKCDGVTDDTIAFESALSSDSSVIKIPKGTTLIRQGQSYISYGVKKKIVGEEGSIIKCDFDDCKHFLNLSINVEFENVTFDFNNKNILNAITFSKNVGLIRMKNVTFQNVNDSDSTKSTVIVNITDGEVDIDNVKFKNMKKRGNGSVTDGGGNLTGLGYFPKTERKGQIKNVTVNDTHNVNAEGQIIFEDVSGVYIAGDATNSDVLLVENIGGYNFGKRLVKTQCSNIRMKNVCGYSDVGDSLSCVGIGDTSSQGDSEITQSNIIVENIYAMGKIMLPISTSCKNVIFRNGFFDTDYCDIPGNTGGSRAFSVTGSDVSFENIIARTNVIGFIDNHPIESLKDVSGKNISFNNCSFEVKDASQVYGITTSYGKEAKLDNIKLHNVDIIYGSAKMGIIDFSRGVFNNIDIDNLNVEYPNADANFSANGIILDKCNNTNIGKINFKSNSVKGLYEGIKANQCTNLTIDNVATDQNDPENKCRLLNIQNSTGVSVSNIKKGNYKYLAFNNCQDVYLSDVDSSKVTNINSSITMDTTFNNKEVLDRITQQDLDRWNSGAGGSGLTTEQVQQLQQAYTHSTSPHAPSDAQKNSDITKEEIEAKLTGDITTHTHSEYTGGKKQRFITQQEYDSLSSTGQLDNNTVYNITDAPVGIVIKKVTQQQYDTESHDTNTLYVIVG